MKFWERKNFKLLKVFIQLEELCKAFERESDGKNHKFIVDTDLYPRTLSDDITGFCLILFKTSTRLYI